MCGIIGYVGSEEATPILLHGLRRLEYRGYDSSGLAVANGRNALSLRKRSGRLRNLRQLVAEEPALGSCGISHTRWATHGEPTDENAHPHVDRSGRLALVHNGVIENYQPLRKELETAGNRFSSQTDSEVLAHLIGNFYDASIETGESPESRLVDAVRSALQKVAGTYGIAVLHADAPGFLVGARLGSPLVVGLGKGKRKGHRVLGIVNTVGSTIPRESDGGSYLHAGPEIGVAATKSFTSQVTLLSLLGLLMGRMRHLSFAEGCRLLEEIRALPAKAARILEQSDHIREIALKYIEAPGMLFLGRQFNYPAALEGALKMKEISYHFAVARGCDVDKPRNLAKSVTVE